MANIWDLTGTTVAANYRRVYPSTQLGTRKLRVIKVVVGGGAPSLVTGQSLSDSSYSKTVLALQNYAEVWVIGKPSATGFLAIISDDTAQDSALDANAVTVPGTWANAEADIVARLGGTCTITDQYLTGITLADVDPDVYDGTAGAMAGSNQKY
jgi:hypothetical protein